MVTYLTGNLKSSNESLIPVRSFGAMARADIEAGFGPVGNIFNIDNLASVAKPETTGPRIGVLPSGAYSTTACVTDVQAVLGADYHLHGLYGRVTDTWMPSILTSHRTVTSAQFYITLEMWGDGMSGANHPTYSCATIVAGNHNTALIQWANDLKAFTNETFIVRPMHEMNATPYPWSVGFNGNTAADYIAAWRHIVDLFAAQGVTNVDWFWCPSDSDNPTVAMSAAYPGDAYVDYVGLDGFNWGTTQAWSTWKTPAQTFDAKLNEIATFASVSKPRIIGETSCVEGAGGSKADWIAQLYPWAQERGLYGFCWFDWDYSGWGDPDWRINTSTSALGAARDWFITDDAYLRYLSDDWGVDITISVPFTAQQAEAWTAYDWHFESGYQFNGVGNSGGKLPGFYGGSGLSASGGNDASTGFSTRSIWRADGLARGYLYHPDKPGTYGEDVQFVQNWGVNNANYFWPVGSWFRVITRIVMNTNGTTYNGEYHVWVDELDGNGPVKRYERTGIRWRTSTSYTVDRFVMVTFYGGDDYTWYPGTPQYSRSKKLEIGTAQLWTGENPPQAISLQTIGGGATSEPTLVRGSSGAILLGTISGGTTHEPALTQGGGQIIGLETIAASGTSEPALVIGAIRVISLQTIGGGTTREPKLVLEGSIARWRMKLVSERYWTNLWVIKFETKDRTEAAQFGLQGRSYDGVVLGRMLGMQAKMEILVRTAAQDEEVMTILRAGANIDVESSLGQAWVMRVVNNIDREQNLAAATGAYSVKHEYFLGFTMTEAL